MLWYRGKAKTSFSYRLVSVLEPLMVRKACPEGLYTMAITEKITVSSVHTHLFAGSKVETLRHIRQT